MPSNQNGDVDKSIALRTYARYILDIDFETNPDLEKESPVNEKVGGKSTTGMQIYKNYTMFAHFFYLRQMLGKTKYLTLYNNDRIIKKN